MLLPHVAVALGFAVFVIGSFMPRGAVSEQPPTLGLAAGSIAYGAVFAALGGLSAASLGGRRPLAHAVVVAGLIALAALVHPWLEPGVTARWLDVAAVLIMAPAAVLAGLSLIHISEPTDS